MNTFFSSRAMKKRSKCVSLLVHMCWRVYVFVCVRACVHSPARVCVLMRVHGHTHVRVWVCLSGEWKRERGGGEKKNRCEISSQTKQNWSSKRKKPGLFPREGETWVQACLGFESCRHTFINCSNEELFATRQNAFALIMGEIKISAEKFWVSARF